MVSKKKSLYDVRKVVTNLAKRLTEIFSLILQNINNMHSFDIAESSPWYKACFLSQAPGSNIFSHPVNVKLFKCLNGNIEPFNIAYVITIDRESVILRSYFKNLIDSIATCIVDDNQNVIFSIISCRLKEYVGYYYGVNVWLEDDISIKPIFSGRYDRLLFAIACHEVRHAIQVLGDVNLRTIDEMILQSDITYNPKFLSWLADTWENRRSAIFHRYKNSPSLTMINKMAREEDAFVAERLTELIYDRYVSGNDFKKFWQKIGELVCGNLKHPF